MNVQQIYSFHAKNISEHSNLPAATQVPGGSVAGTPNIKLTVMGHPKAVTGGVKKSCTHGPGKLGVASGVVEVGLKILKKADPPKVKFKKTGK